ncbi:MbcA/ParS/Xre antitoxin family protein [Marinobacter sp. MBR-105]|jgi:hypothetical protein
MSTLANNQEKPSAQKMAEVGLRTVFNILDKWGCTPDQAQAILRIPKATFYKYRKEPAKARLDDDQLARLSYLLHIHQALRIVFSNPDNVYGFMTKANHNPFFNGRSPLEVISSGQFSDLYETYKRIDVLRGGQW